MYIDTYSEAMAYLEPQKYLGIIKVQFMHILNLIQTDSGIFRTLAYLDK